ncbi:TetR/AcrR family transcriptional regulator [Phytomonospora sp. NPDC050363]|uniref:TetR/AcrR family transcriptional regulator n=1 Tax=Phytomonospora sp. NPDC050363 TaxID=3155642 RepID=UPI0033D87043
MDAKLLDAAMSLLAETTWDGLTLGAVADRAGVSRATFWRQVGGKDELRAALISRLAVDYRDALWPILTADGTGRDRLRAALEALCEVADRHLPLLSAVDTAFHDAEPEDKGGSPAGFVGPLTRLIRDGMADGSLAEQEDPETAGDLVFNTVCWPYVHLRRHHGWAPGKARTPLLDLVVGGMAT